MKLLIDTNDGAGEVDYTAAVRAAAPLHVLRARGTWTVCEAGLDLAGTGLALPRRRAHVRVTDATGTVLFAGVAEAAARAVNAGVSTNGANECVMLRAVERAWLTSSVPVYELQPATSAQHTMSLSDVALRIEDVDSPTGDLANDVTVTGEGEAATYVTELFRGDGSTQSFVLQHQPFRESGEGTLVDDAFDGAALNAAAWSRLDAGGYLSPGSGGLRMNGGTGVDGATVLSYTGLVELGGSLVAEASGVMLAPGSDGVLLGFYDGMVSRGQCVAGVRVRGAAGAQTFVALVNGAEQPTTYEFAAGHSYTLRVRLHCLEMQRVRTRYAVLVDGVLQEFGGEAVDEPLRVVIEVVDSGLASSTLPAVLYDGAMASSPLQSVFAPVNSIALNGSVGRVSLQQTGSCLVRTTTTDGTVRTRRQGLGATGADYSFASSGVVTFAPGLVPRPGELIAVQYRMGRRSAARRLDETAAFVAASLGLPGVPRWSGRVVRPAARSSADCDAAARALLALGAGSATGVSGTVSWTRGVAVDADVQVGDTLLVSGAEGPQVLPVTRVQVEDTNCDPERVMYTATFGQSRAASMDFRVARDVAPDVVLPIAVAVDEVLPTNLSGLQVAVATMTALQIDTGVDGPDGYGFEVRRSDANFGSASTADLVLRSPVRSFSVPRAAFAERFFVRMYDAAVPPRYSAVSSMVVTSLPVS